MKVKSVEIIVSEVVEIDQRTDRELLKIQKEIQKQESQFKSIIGKVKQDYDQLQRSQGRILCEESMRKAMIEKESIFMKSLEKTERMEVDFERNEELILLKAIQETSLGKWES